MLPRRIAESQADLVAPPLRAARRAPGGPLNGIARRSRWASDAAGAAFGHAWPPVPVGVSPADSWLSLPLRGIEHEIQLCLPEASGQTPGPGRTVRLVLYRGPGSDFSERDRALLVLLRPHLHQAYLDTERRRDPVPRLTLRQRELLRLLAAGYTNTQIARRLGISEGTVRTHLENIYTRLNVSSRTAAVTRAFPDRVSA